MRNLLLASILVSACAEGDPSDPVGPFEDPRTPSGETPSGVGLPEAPSPDTPAMVRVERAGAPVAGADVVFHGADGAVIGHTATGDDGSAAGVVEPGALVTIAWRDGDSHNAHTIAGVDPGDEVTFILGAVALDPSLGALRARLPGATAGATAYTIDLGCAAETVVNPSPAYTIPVRQSCLTGAGESANVFATAHDSSGRAVAWTFAGDVVLENPGPAAVNLPSWSTSWQEITVELAGAPSGARAVLLSADWAIAEGTFPAADEPSSVLAAGSNVALATRVPSMAAQGLTSRIIIGHGGGSTLSGLSERVEQHDGVPPVVSLGMTGDFLPAVTAPSLDLAEAARPAIGWQSAASLEGADVGRVELAWSDASGLHAWTAFVPPSATAPVVLPELPEALAAWRPTAEATFGVPQVTFYQADWISGFESVKASGFAIEMPAGPHTLLSSSALNP